MTARLLTEEPIEIVPDLREHERHSSDWVYDFEQAVRRAFAHPEVPAYDGWEPLSRCRDRVVRAAEGILATHRGSDVVLVGHGTAWTCLVSALSGDAARPRPVGGDGHAGPPPMPGGLGPGDMLSP